MKKKAVCKDKIMPTSGKQFYDQPEFGELQQIRK